MFSFSRWVVIAAALFVLVPVLAIGVDSLPWCAALPKPQPSVPEPAELLGSGIVRAGAAKVGSSQGRRTESPRRAVCPSDSSNSWTEAKRSAGSRRR